MYIFCPQIVTREIEEVPMCQLSLLARDYWRDGKIERMGVKPEFFNSVTFCNITICTPLKIRDVKRARNVRLINKETM